MINLFRKPLSEVEAAQAAVETATAKCERIRTQLTDTERELVASKEAAADHAAEGHSLDDWAHDIASSEAACSALRTALERTAGELKEAQAALAEAQDAEHRAKSVATINGIVQGVDQKQQAFLSALADLVSVLKPAADINP